MPTTSPPPSPSCSHPSPSTSTSSSNEDQLPTPRASTHPAAITLTEDYFAPPLPPRPSLEVTTSSALLSIQSASSSGASTPGLQAKPTTAISLPEGVHAQQQDAVVSGNGSVTGTPSFSDSVSVKSLVPTLSAGDNDVESMLGEILEGEGEEGGFLKARRDIMSIGSGGAGIEEVEFEDEGWDESSDEEGLGEGWLIHFTDRGG